MVTERVPEPTSCWAGVPLLETGDCPAEGPFGVETPIPGGGDDGEKEVAELLFRGRELR